MVHRICLAWVPTTVLFVLSLSDSSFAALCELALPQRTNTAVETQCYMAAVHPFTGIKAALQWQLIQCATIHSIDHTCLRFGYSRLLFVTADLIPVASPAYGPVLGRADTTCPFLRMFAFSNLRRPYKKHHMSDKMTFAVALQN